MSALADAAGHPADLRSAALTVPVDERPRGGPASSCTARRGWSPRSARAGSSPATEPSPDRGASTWARRRTAVGRRGGTTNARRGPARPLRSRDACVIARPSGAVELCSRAAPRRSSRASCDLLGLIAGGCQSELEIWACQHVLRPPGVPRPGAAAPPRAAGRPAPDAGAAGASGSRWSSTVPRSTGAARPRSATCAGTPRWPRRLDRAAVQLPPADGRPDGCRAQIACGLPQPTARRPCDAVPMASRNPRRTLPRARTTRRARPRVGDGLVERAD